MPGIDRIRILIVEREGLVGCDMAASLGKLGYIVSGICASGEEALQRFDEMQPDLVLLDVHLAGEIDGIETARRLQTRSSVAILYVTAWADLETVKRARETHPQGYLLKPFSHDELRLVVEVAAQQHFEEKERRRREHSFFEAFQRLADGVIVADPDGGIVFINPAAARVTGWSPHEAAGMSLNEVFRIFRASGEPVEVMSAEGEMAGGVERTVWLTKRSGHRVPIMDRGKPMRDALGLLARGFAHDFNNLLTVLLGNISLAEMRLRSAITLPELQTAKQATLQAQNLVHQLLTFARGGAPIKRLTNVGDLIDIFFAHHTRAARIDYRIETQPNLPSIPLDPAQVRRLLCNLIRNAEQAQPEGGQIVVRAFVPDHAQMFPGELVTDQNFQPSGIAIEVQDFGEGILADHLPHIFEPYFSTRKGENATGLGLTVCESIANAHGGTTTVSSDQGRGTSVRFYVPLDADAEEVEGFGLSHVFDAAPDATVSQPPILVLEDDPLVRNLIARNLVSQGFEVTESAEGSETVRLYQESMNQGRVFDLVVLDLSIPNGIGGVRTMEKLRQLDSEVLSIVSSGYSDDPVMA